MQVMALILPCRSMTSGENLTDVRSVHTNRTFCLYRFLLVCRWIPYCLPVAAAVRCLSRRCCKTLYRSSVALVTLGLPLCGWSATFPLAWNHLHKRSIVFQVQLKCRDTTVADMPAFSIPVGWFHSSLFSLGIFFDLFQHNFIKLWRILKNMWSRILTPDMDMRRTKRTRKMTWVFFFFFGNT